MSEKAERSDHQQAEEAAVSDQANISPLANRPKKGGSQSDYPSEIFRVISIKMFWRSGNSLKCFGGVTRGSGGANKFREQPVGVWSPEESLASQVRNFAQSLFNNIREGDVTSYKNKLQRQAWAFGGFFEITSKSSPGFSWGKTGARVFYTNGKKTEQVASSKAQAWLRSANLSKPTAEHAS